MSLRCDQPAQETWKPVFVVSETAYFVIKKIMGEIWFNVKIVSLLEKQFHRSVSWKNHHDKAAS